MHAPGGRTAVTGDELFDELPMALDTDTQLNEMIVTHLVAHSYT